MAETGLEAEREKAVQILTAAYAQDRISTEELETRLQTVTDAASRSAIEVAVSDLRETPLAASAADGLSLGGGERQVMQGSMQRLRREGHWLRSHRITIVQTGSSMRLDFDELAGRAGEVFEVELLLKGCSCRIKVPRGTRIEEQLEPHMSSYRCSGSLRRHDSAGGCTLVLRGKVVASSIRISPSRSRTR